jgi:plasmid stabilization system protein ParE
MPKTRQVRLTADALADLEEIKRFIGLDSPRRARSFTRDLRVACLALGEMAERFPIIRRRADGIYRRRPFASFSIIYRIDDEIVFIVRVYSSARDLDRLFPEA